MNKRRLPAFRKSLLSGSSLYAMAYALGPLSWKQQTSILNLVACHLWPHLAGQVNRQVANAVRDAK